MHAACMALRQLGFHIQATTHIILTGFATKQPPQTKSCFTVVVWMTSCRVNWDWYECIQVTLTLWAILPHPSRWTRTPVGGNAPSIYTGWGTNSCSEEEAMCKQNVNTPLLIIREELLWIQGVNSQHVKTTCSCAFCSYVAISLFRNKRRMWDITLTLGAITACPSSVAGATVRRGTAAILAAWCAGGYIIYVETKRFKFVILIV